MRSAVTSRATVLATRRRRQGLPLHDQPRRRDGRRRRDGVPRGRRGREHGVLPVPPDLPLPSRRPSRFLISEALRGEGAILRLPDGTRVHGAATIRDGELAPRDIVARAIDFEMKQSRRRTTCSSTSRTRAPTSSASASRTSTSDACASASTSRQQPIPVVPAAHYMCGGVHDRPRRAHDDPAASGRSASRACTGLHGANRLASNSLLEGLVFGHRALRSAREDVESAGGAPPDVPDWDPGRAIRATRASSSRRTGTSSAA